MRLEPFPSLALDAAAAILLLKKAGWVTYRAIPPPGDHDPLPESVGDWFAARLSDGRTLRGRSPLDLVRRIGEATELAGPFWFEQDVVDELDEAA